MDTQVTSFAGDLLIIRIVGWRSQDGAMMMDDEWWMMDDGIFTWSMEEQFESKVNIINNIQ